MANLPTNRTAANTIQEHVDDHNTLNAFHNLIDAAGDLIVGVGPDAAGKLVMGAALTVLRVNAGATALEFAAPASTILQQAAEPGSPSANDLWIDTDAVPLSGTNVVLLVYKTYVHPTTYYQTTSSTSADVDATNLAVTFTAPASGVVRIVLNAFLTQSTAAAYPYWSVREASSDIAGPYKTSVFVSPGMNTMVFYKTGLTPGNSYTYKWGWKIDGGLTLQIYTQATWPPAVMEVWAA